MPVECPATATQPARILASPGDGTDFFVGVAPTGAVNFQVLVEGSDVPLRMPPIVLRHGADQAVMAHGCGGVISLAWGYETSDSCGTTVPSAPFETLELVEGAAATVTIDGWTITDASASCGRLVSQSGSPDQLEAMQECAVAVTLNESTITVSGLPRAANSWVLELSFTARNAAGDSFSGPNYVFVHVR